MAEETLTLRMRAQGAARTAAEIETVGHAVEGLDSHTRGSARSFDRLSALFGGGAKRMAALGAVAASTTLAVGGVGTAIVGLVGVLTSLAAVAGVGAMVGVGAFLLWRKTVDQTGSAANALRSAFGALREAFESPPRPPPGS